MCGLAALFCPPGARAAPLLARMSASLAHRGPDGAGLVAFVPGDRDAAAGAPDAPWRAAEDGPAGLAHRRLAIIDLTAGGHQPMRDPSGRWWLVYNGELYNHLELRAELARLGHAFTSHSDSEVLLHAWQQWGADCLRRFNGMFAFVLFDAATGTVHAARDRFGIKPLYWWVAPDGTLALASEIKAFTVLPGWRARLDGQRAYDFLNWTITDHTDATLFAGVAQLQGGMRLEARAPRPRSPEGQTATGAPILTRWYTLRPDPAAATLDLPHAARRFAELFEDSVRLQLRADVAVGSCLSGGLDSSSVVCVARRVLEGMGAHGGQHAFSARAEVAALDEGRWIDTVVAHTGVHGHQVTPRVDALLASLPDIIWHQDEPFASTSSWAQWCVFGLAREAGLKVLLDGQGADELLAGYHGFFGPRLAGLLRGGRWLRLARELRLLRQVHGWPARLALARMADALLPDALRQRLRKAAGKPAAQAGLLDPGRLGDLGCVPRDPFVAAGARGVSVGELSRIQLTATNLPMLLHSEDRNSMAHGVEARVPFLDHRLVEFTLGLAEDHKIADATTKRVLRAAMRDTLPAAVRGRTDKLGFVTPEEHWMRQVAPQAFRARLATAIETSRGIIRPAALAGFDAMLAGSAPFDQRWWRCIAFAAWLERFSVETGGSGGSGGSGAPDGTG